MSCSMPTTSVMWVTRRRPVAEAGHLHEQVDGRRYLLADGAHPHIRVGHADHDFEAAQSIAGRVGVNRGERTIVARVHGLQHVQRLFRANLAHDDAIGAHAQGVDDELPDVDGADALHIGRPVSMRATCVCCSRSSAASSMVTMRSSSGM